MIVLIFLETLVFVAAVKLVGKGQHVEIHEISGKALVLERKDSFLVCELIAASLFIKIQINFICCVF